MARELRNAGIVVGQVLDQNYAPVQGALACMSGFYSDTGVQLGYSGPNNERYIYAETDRLGKFAIGFAWAPPDIGGTYNYATALLSASVSKESRQGGVFTSQDTAKAVLHVKTRIVKDVKKLIGVFASAAPETAADYADLVVDTALALKKLSPTPFWKVTTLFTPEAWCSLGGGYLILK